MKRNLITDEDNDECFSAPAVSWGLMLDYERNDVVAELCRQFSFFSSDKLILSEREEVLCSSGMNSEDMDSLIIHGSVGNTRKDAFLRLLRLSRLTLVQDLASQVIVAPQIGDVFPNALLEPLWETKQIKSLRRWNSLYWAMRCGLLRKIKRRRDMMRVHVEQILSIKPNENELKSENLKKEGVELANEEAFYNAFRDLLDLEQEEQNAPLDLYHSACSEERVNISYAIANVPTLIVVWASWDITSIEWLRENIFNVIKTGELKSCVALAAAYLSSIGNDPWLQTVQQFVEVPKRVTISKRKKLQRRVKSCQIILISVDRDKKAAIKALNSLVTEVGGWKSPEVSLMPLWCGPEGLQSDLATDLNITELPFFIATQVPDNKKRKFGDGRFPRISYISPYLENDISSIKNIGQNVFEEFRGTNIELIDWHNIQKEERKRVTSAISNFISTSDAPLRFNARVDRSYEMIRSSIKLPQKNMKSIVTSFVSISGTISTLDILKLKKEISILFKVKNLFFDIKIMKPSTPLLTILNPATPNRCIRGARRSITCSECFKDILVDNDQYFRCIHCEQIDGIICLDCFENEKHLQNHILLRVPAGTVTKLNLLWGPSNVAPLSHFCGTLLTNTSETHIGVYCNACSKLVRGVRWKCAMCYQYDMCNLCEMKRKRHELLKSNKDGYPISEAQSPLTAFSVANDHPKDHLFLCIRHGCGIDGDECLKPVIDDSSLKLLLTE